MNQPKKSLGQHWLHDKVTLQAVADAAEVGKDDTVLEIGPGLGTLTKILTHRAGQVLAVELDRELAGALNERIDADNLSVITEDILKFDLAQLPPNYKVAANIPYYLTANLLRVLSESPNPPSKMALLVQKEVAERLAAEPGQMSILAVSVQLDYEVKLGPTVPAELFTPPPKVDSQIVSLSRRSQALFPELDREQFFKVVKAGFSERRKKLRSALAGGLAIDKSTADDLLKKAQISGDHRAQELSLNEWYQLSTSLFN